MGPKLIVPFKKFSVMKGLCFLMLMACGAGAFAQTTDRVTTSPDAPIYNDVSGSAYVVKDWSDGVIRFTSGRVATQFKIKFDCVMNRLLLQYNGSSFATESNVKEFTIYTGKAAARDSMVFRRGFPPAIAEKANEETFYQVVTEGKTTLLCLHIKHITEEQQIASKVIYRRLRDEDVFFLLKEKTMIPLPHDKAIIADQFPDHSDALRKFISEHQLKFRDAGDFKKLVEYYNSLLAQNQ